MNKYLFLLTAITLPNISMAAASSDSESSVSPVSMAAASRGSESSVSPVLMDKSSEGGSLADLIQKNLGKVYVQKAADPSFKGLVRLLADKGVLPEAKAARTVERIGNAAESSLVVIYYDGKKESKEKLMELSSMMEPGSTLMVILKKGMDSEKSLPTPDGFTREDTLKRVYDLEIETKTRMFSKASQKKDIVLFEKE